MAEPEGVVKGVHSTREMLQGIQVFLRNTIHKTITTIDIVSSIILPLTNIMQNAKEVEWSPWSWVRAGIHSYKVVRAKGGIEDVAVGEGSVVLPAHGVVPARKNGVHQSSLK